MATNPELWEVNQGKRLLKRLKSVGVKPGDELAFVLQALRTSAATVEVAKAKRDGKSPEESTGLALEAVARVKVVEGSGHNGLDVYRLLVENGAAPGRVKAELDKVLFVAGITNGCPSELAPPVESPDYEADRFPSGHRENY